MAQSISTMAVLYRLERVRARVGAWLGRSANILMFAGFVLVLGVGSSLYAIETGTRLNSIRQGPWTMWTNAAVREVDPYTRARFARTGALPLSASIAGTYEASYDADGRRLHSSCEYLVESEPFDAVWWSLAVYDDRGLLIPNSAERYSFTSHSIALNPDGSFYIVLARDARPGNWLPVGGAGRLTLILSLIEARAQNPAESVRHLPTIRRIGCR